MTLSTGTRLGPFDILVVVTPDGNSSACTDSRLLSDFFVVEGLK